MERRKFRMAALCRALPKYLCSRADTYRDRLSLYPASAYWVMASPTEDRFGQTTSAASNSSLPRLIIHILEMLRLEIAAGAGRSSFHDEPEWDASRRTICNSHRAPGPRS